MAALAFDELSRRRRKHLPAWIAPTVLIAVALGIVAFFWLQAPTFDQQAARDKVINVALPPPPPPPPPEQKPPEPEKKVIEEPKPQPQTPQPQQQPQPDSPAPVAGEALSARVGTAGNNFGLAAGNGGGTRIGGTAGGDGNGFAAYAASIQSQLYAALRADRALRKGGFAIQIALDIGADGRIRSVRLLRASGERDRDHRIRDVLTNFQLSAPPPVGMPPARWELRQRAGL